MAVFFDTGGGDVYAAETKEACIAAMLEDNPDCEVEDAFEVDGSYQMNAEKEDGSLGDLVTLDVEYKDNGITDHGYCICSDNC